MREYIHNFLCMLRKKNLVGAVRNLNVTVYKSKKY